MTLFTNIKISKCPERATLGSCSPLIATKIKTKLLAGFIN